MNRVEEKGERGVREEREESERRKRVYRERGEREREKATQTEKREKGQRELKVRGGGDYWILWYCGVLDYFGCTLDTLYYSAHYGT